MSEGDPGGGYEERPSPLRDGAVVWTRTAAGVGHHRVLPDGCMDIIWTGGELIVAGPDTRAHLAPDRPGARYTGLRFAPGAAPGVLGVPAYELRDLRTPLSSVWPARRVGLLAEHVAGAAEPAGALESAVLQGPPGPLDRRGPPDGPGPPGAAGPVLATVVAAIRRGSSVPAIAERVGLSERQFRRRCLDAFGYGPKTLARVLRMNRAVGLLRSGMPLAEIAVRAGYADQAHLTREVKALTGVPPGALTVQGVPVVQEAWTRRSGSVG